MLVSELIEVMRSRAANLRKLAQDHNYHKITRSRWADLAAAYENSVALLSFPNAREVR